MALLGGRGTKKRRWEVEGRPAQEFDERSNSLSEKRGHPWRIYACDVPVPTIYANAA